MQLTYRGIQYELTSAISSVPGEVIGKYRGGILRTHRCVVSPRSQSLNLVYRGAHYRAMTNHLELPGSLNAI